MISLTMRPLTPVLIGLSRRELTQALQAMLQALGSAGRHLDVLVARDREAIGSNERFLGLAGPTNVLSFPGDSDDPRQLGSVCLNADAVHREAFLYRQPPGGHCLRLLAHGTLHLIGLSHGADMEGWTERLLEQLA